MTRADELRIMPPRSWASIESEALRFTTAVCREHLEGPQPLPVLELIEYRLMRHGLFVYPVADDQMPDAYAETKTDGEPGDPIDIVIRDSGYSSLDRGGARAYHARASIAHELGHALLHVPYIRERRRAGHGLARAVHRSTLRPFENPEDQAWHFAGCMLAPRAMIMAAGTLDPSALAYIFSISVPLMRNHLRRLRIL